MPLQMLVYYPLGTSATAAVLPEAVTILETPVLSLVMQPYDEEEDLLLYTCRRSELVCTSSREGI